MKFRGLNRGNQESHIPNYRLPACTGLFHSALTKKRTRKPSGGKLKHRCTRRYNRDLRSNEAYRNSGTRVQVSLAIVEELVKGLITLTLN